MSGKRVARTITNKDDIEYLLNITEDEITLSFVMENFGTFNNKCRFNPYDIVSFPPNSYGPEGKRNKNTMTTTVGLWVYNKYFFEKELFNLFKYMNKTVNKGVFGKINADISYALLEDDIDIRVMENYLMKTQKVMPFVSILSPGFTMKMLTSSKEIEKKKKQLMPKYKARLEAGDELAAEELEAELKAYAREYLADDPSMDCYNSGARGSFDNNYKNMFIMKGASKDPDPNKGYDIMLSNLMDGVSKEDYVALSNSLAAGPYQRAKKTSVGGYLEKQFVEAFQHIVLDKEGTDCHTDKYIKVYLTDKNISDWMYSYIIDGNSLVELNSKTKSKYLGKEVKMRFASLCKSKTGYCNKCVGNLFYKLGFRDIGLALASVPATLKNLSMKSFHDSVVKTTTMDVMKAFNIK